MNVYDDGQTTLTSAEYKALMDELRRVKGENEMLWERIADLQGRLAREECEKLQASSRRVEMEEEFRYVRELAANSCLSAAQKWVMWAVRDVIHRTGRYEEQFTEIDIRDLSKRIGLSRDRTGANLMSLSETGAIVRKERYDVTEGHNGGGKQFRTRVLVGLTLFSDKPKEIVPPSPRNHGGKRERCEKCGGENLEVYEAYICKDCGHIHQAELKKETKGKRGFVSESQA